MLNLILIFFIVLFCINLISAVKDGNVFVLCARPSSNKNMTVFQLQQHANRAVFAGEWRKEGEPGFLIGVVLSVIAIFILVFFLI